jgi:beta-1,2-mannobiose phosphorylase / 1,2-beta-oligomannan phosphorylase
MVTVHRSDENPILVGDSHNHWEAQGAFNGCPIKGKRGVFIFYRAQSSPLLHSGIKLELSTIGRAKSSEGIHFKDHQQFIYPEYEWEQFGCEDPRVVKFEDKYYIFYTALSKFPFTPDGISIGMAITKDLDSIEEKHHVTPFNSKAMAIFPERVNGKIVAILTANTDLPPSKISLAMLDNIEDLWSDDYWKDWYQNLDAHALPLQRRVEDHIELGAPPLKTKKGWLVIYSYIKDYQNYKRLFGIEAALLDLENPHKILGRTELPLLVPEEEYELYGKVPNVIFPSGARINGKMLDIYYGAADTTCCVASCSLKELLNELLEKKGSRPSFKRFENNPIMEPASDHPWECKAVFNPAVIRDKGKMHILYRAVSADDTSVLGYASSSDGFHIDERLTEPAYVPRTPFEMKLAPGNSGCEDPRLTRIGRKIYMCYTSVDAKNPPRVGLTSIKATDFFNHHWKWTMPKIISPPQVDDKDACIFPEKINGKFAIIHRVQPSIDINYFDSLDFKDGKILEQHPIILPRKGMWDSQKIGLNTVPLKTRSGWLIIYHGVSDTDNAYRLGALLLKLDDPEKVIARSKFPIMEPEMIYEKRGSVNNVVFPCGAVIVKSNIYIYYGGADTVIGGAFMNINKLLKSLLEN